MTVQIVPHGHYQDIGRPPYYDFEVLNGCLFPGVSTDFLDRIFTNSNRKKWTLFFGIKPTLQTVGGFLGVYVDAGNRFQVGWITNHVLYVYTTQTGQGTSELTTVPFHRDPTQHHYFTVTLDTAQATASERLKLWHNGDRLTFSGTPNYPSQNQDFVVNGPYSHIIGNRGEKDSPNSDYWSEVFFIDGEAYDPTAWLTLNDYGYWMLKTDISGINFNNPNTAYLAFADSQDLGLDFGPHGNNFTVNGTGIKQVTDTPTNNFPTWNSVDKRVNSSSLAAYSFSNGNRRWSFTSSGFTGTSRATMISRIPSYWEVDIKARPGTNPEIGIIAYGNQIESYVSGGRPGAAYWSATGNFSVEGSSVATVSSYIQGDTLGFAYNPQTREMNLFKNGVAEAANPITLPAKFADVFTMFCYAGANAAAFTFDLNTGNPIASGYTNQDQNGRGLFRYPVPSGFFASCTQNMLELLDYEVVDGRNAFYVEKRAGTGAQADIANQFNAMEDNKALSIMKKTNIGNWDTARQGGKSLNLNDTRVEQDTVDKQILFLNNLVKGVRVETHTDVNALNDEYLDWMLNAQDPTKYGVQLVIDQGTGVATNFPHNGGKEPSMMWRKKLTNVGGGGGWYVYHKYMDAVNPENYYMYLNSNAARALNATVWDNTKPNATHYRIGNASDVNQLNEWFLTVLFFDIPFLCSAFRFTSNNNADGPMIALDHLPALIFAKRYTVNLGDWAVWDIGRNIYNPSGRTLAFNDSRAETLTNYIDILASGAKWRDTDYNDANDFLGFSFGRYPSILANAR